MQGVFAFVYKVLEYFEILCDSIHQAFEYFENTYIGRFRRNAPPSPSLSWIDVWNMFCEAFNELPRKDNSIEGWDRSFQANITFSHPVFYKFIEVWNREETFMKVKILQSLGNHIILHLYCEFIMPLWILNVHELVRLDLISVILYFNEVHHLKKDLSLVT